MTELARLLIAQIDADGPMTLADYMTGLYGCIGVLIALRHRDITGEGQYVDAALYESVFRCTEELATAYGLHRTVRERTGSQQNDFACPHGHFSTRDGKWVAISCATDQLFARLAGAMKQPELALPSNYGVQATRLARAVEVNEIVRDWCVSLTRAEILQRCEETGTPAGPLNNIADIFGDRQVHARRNLVAIDAADINEVVIVPAPVPRLSETPGSIRSLGPELGEHTDEVLSEVLGLDEARLAELHASKVI